MEYFRRYVWRRVTPVAGVDLAVQKSELCLLAEQVSPALNLKQHGSTGATRSSLLALGCPVKVTVF